VETKQLLIGEVTQEQIEAWKKQYKQGIYAIKINGKIVYFRNPDIKDMNIAMSQTTPDNQLDYFLTIFRETRIGGAEEAEFIGEPKSFMAYVEQVKVKIEAEQGELVNL
jgi:hypothetical protein